MKIKIKLADKVLLDEDIANEVTGLQVMNRIRELPDVSTWKSIMLVEVSGKRWYNAQTLAEFIGTLSEVPTECVIFDAKAPEQRISGRVSTFDPVKEQAVAPKNVLPVVVTDQDGTRYEVVTRALQLGTENVVVESGEVYKCPILATLPYQPVVKYDRTACETAVFKLGSLTGVVGSHPDNFLNAAVFVAGCIECHSTSKIENINIPLELLLRSMAPGLPYTDEEEKVFSMVSKLVSGVKVVSSDWRFDVPQLLQLHGEIMSYDPRALPGIFRQTSAGGVGEFVTPNHKKVDNLVSNLVLYVQDSTDHFIVKAAISHLQFEVIHPFTDGNGRVGRVLLYHVLANGLVGMSANKLLVLYIFLSRQLRMKQNEYFRLLKEAFARGAVEWWVNWFLVKFEAACDEAIALLKVVSTTLGNIVATTTHTKRTLSETSIAEVFSILSSSVAMRVDLLAAKVGGEDATEIIEQLVVDGALQRLDGVVILPSMVKLVASLLV